MNILNQTFLEDPRFFGQFSLTLKIKLRWQWREKSALEIFVDVFSSLKTTGLQDVHLLSCFFTPKKVHHNSRKQTSILVGHLPTLKKKTQIYQQINSCFWFP